MRPPKQNRFPTRWRLFELALIAVLIAFTAFWLPQILNRPRRNVFKADHRLIDAAPDKYALESKSPLQTPTPTAR